ncbi:hypothetical protein H5T87_04670 [bacterium]|nr:hypothetical protein [bacterium]
MKEQKKRKYEAPRLTVVPLKVEERLLSCGKFPPGQGGGGCEGLPIHWS